MGRKGSGSRGFMKGRQPRIAESAEDSSMCLSGTEERSTPCRSGRSHDVSVDSPSVRRDGGVNCAVEAEYSDPVSDNETARSQDNANCDRRESRGQMEQRHKRVHGLVCSMFVRV